MVPVLTRPSSLSARQWRIALWLVWPIFVVVFGIGVLHFLQYRLGWHVHVVWSPYGLLHAIPVIMMPPLILEIVLNGRRAH